MEKWNNGKRRGSCAIPMMVLVFAGTLFSQNLPTAPSLHDRLAFEVMKVVDAGHLRPAYCVASEQYAQFQKKRAWDFSNYWHNPADMIYTLARALPHLPAGAFPSDASKTWQQKVKEYMQNEFDNYKPYQWTHMGSSGAQRENHLVPAEIGTENWGEAHGIQGTPGVNGWTGWSFNPFNFYACWKYAQVFGNAKWVLDQMRDKIKAMPTDDTWLQERPHVVNAYIAGYLGFLGLQDLAGETRSSQVEGWLSSALQKRIQFFSFDHSLLYGYEAGGFLYLVPELGHYLNQNALSTVKQWVATHQWAAPYWFKARAEETTRHSLDRGLQEGAMSHYHEVSSLFNAKAYALKETQAELELYLDVPAVYRGDLYHIQNLVATIEAGGTSGSEPSQDKENKPKAFFGVHTKPFSQGLVVQYSAPARSAATATLFDAQGRSLAVLRQEIQQAGTHRTLWQIGDDSGNMPPGVYYLQLTLGTQRAWRRIVWMW